jgi:glycosyltransferase involved in cell wall biosynthesis
MLGKYQRPVRIGIDARELFRPDTGIGNYVVNLIQALANIDRENEYFLFVNSVAEGSLNKLDYPANFTFVPVAKSTVDKFQDQVSMALAMRRLDLHVFHATHHDVAPLLSRVPLIVTIHDIAPIAFRNPSLLHRIYYVSFSRLVLHRACFLLCISNSTGQHLEQQFPFCQGKWSTIYSGRDRYFKVYDEQEVFFHLRDRLGISQPFILYVGSFARRKNLVNMIRAFSIVKSSKANLQFVIVGGPSGRDDVIPSELPPGVIIAGQVSKQELRSLYNKAQLLLFTTLYEGFGFPLIEAMACGCPVVTSPLTSLPELGGEAVLYAAPHNPQEIAGQIMRILNEKGLRMAMVDKGLREVLRFNWEATARGALQIYRKLPQREKDLYENRY